MEMGRVVEAINRSPARLVHFDIEDGVFVQEMTLGTRMIGELRPFTSLPFDVHLMVVAPERIIPLVVKLGADRVSVHWEACEYPLRTLGLIRESGASAGLALNPRTSVPPLEYLVPTLDFVNVLSTEGQDESCRFIAPVLRKVKELKNTLQGIECQVDGGITAENIGEVVRTGADTVVVGRYVFRNDDWAGNIESLARAAGMAARRSRGGGGRCAGGAHSG
jgi:ribulose-phosphate 3-epimerase